MKAFILAAGLGTRLKPWTLSHPKALVPVGGTPMLRRVIESLKSQGFDNLVVNVHHFSSQIVDYVHDNDFGIDIQISDETEQLMDTGGGIVKAYASLVHGDEPFLIHNVDILTDADLEKFMRRAKESDADVLLLVSNRTSSRKLIFDSHNILKGWHNTVENRFIPENLVPCPEDKELAFSGIYAMKRGAVEEMKNLYGDAPFPIMDYFLNPKRKSKIEGYEIKDMKLIDIGKPDTLDQANKLF